jgi:cyanate permease
MQVLAQAAGPLAAGMLRDVSGAHGTSLAVFATLSALAVMVALLARAPEPPRA